MNKYITIKQLWPYLRNRLHLCVVLSWLCLAGMGYQIESSGGWVLPSAWGLAVSHKQRGVKKRRRLRLVRKWRRRTPRHRSGHLPVPRVSTGLGDEGLRPLLTRRGVIAGLRSLVLVGCWWWGGWAGWWWAGWLPWAVWGWQALGLVWPVWQRQPEWRWGCQIGREVERLALLAGLCVVLSQATVAALRADWSAMPALWLSQDSSERELAILLCGLGVTSGSRVSLRQAVNEGGEVVGYEASLEGRFELSVAADDFFRRRLLILFLRLLEEPGHERGSRRTREGRTPAVRQQALAAAYNVTQPEISRWERYWQTADWRRLLSERAQELLTQEVQERIVAVFAQFPWWGVAQVYEHLRQQGEKVSQRQVCQAAQESGWSRLRQELQRRYHITSEAIRPRDNWLVSQLLTSQQLLLARLEAADGLTRQEKVELADLNQLVAEVAADCLPASKGLPWAYRLEQLLFGSWQLVEDGQVRCLYCQTTQVARKSRQPRYKQYYDESGQIQTISVYRYYCHNAACDKGSFTHLPSGLRPYSPYREQVHLLALQLVVWSRTTYRRSATALALSPATVYRWVTAYGGQLLPIAAIFGVVRCSGVVGIDEKYVLVPKNDKPQAKMKRWCYVSVAVDCYTYDLLHIAIFAHRDEASSRAFLLALKAKGYRPQVVVTDLWPGYANLVADIFPQATHQECIFHALQEVQRLVKTIYGSDYRQAAPEAVALKQAIYYIFEAGTRRTAHKRYQAVMALREAYTAQSQEVAALFAFLEHHWPKLAGAIGSKMIPTTNNATELVIRRFDQHYQNFCGFDNLASAQLFLAVFEKCYRFTPFSPDAQPHLRGKCPLQVAGYDISQIPMTAVGAGWSPHWPVLLEANSVPNL